MVEAILGLPGLSLAAVQRTHQPFWTPLLSIGDPDDSPGLHLGMGRNLRLGENSYNQAVTQVRGGMIVKTQNQQQYRMGPVLAAGGLHVG